MRLLHDSYPNIRELGIERVVDRGTVSDCCFVDDQHKHHVVVFELFALQCCFFHDCETQTSAQRAWFCIIHCRLVGSKALILKEV